MELIAPAADTTMSAEKRSVWPARSTWTAAISRPEALVSRRVTFASVSSVTLGCSSAGFTQQTCESAFALTRHGWPSHVLHRMHGLVCGFLSSSMMPSGV